MKNTYIHHEPAEPTQLVQQDIPPLKDDEYLVKNTKSLVSVGTEISWLKENGIRGGSGYASVGKVVEIGKGITRFKLGDRVVSGGNHAQYTHLSAGSQVYRIPDGVTDLQATYCALGGVAMYIASRSDISIGRTVVVVGQGTVGQLVNQMARIAGAGMIVGVDVDSRRFKLSRELGAGPKRARQSLSRSPARMKLWAGFLRTLP
jgi:threonine dehydrogenase-like Zn-dependent dehydrogenase